MCFESMGSFGSGLGSGMQAGGALLSAVGAYNGSRQNKASLEAQARISDINAATAETQAKDAITRGEREANIARGKTAQLKGHQKASLAANGVDIGTGSALQILVDTDAIGEQDVGTIRDNAAREAWALRQSAITGTMQSDLYRARAKAESPLAAVGTSLLTSAGKVADRWYPAPKKA